MNKRIICAMAAITLVRMSASTVAVASSKDMEVATILMERVSYFQSEASRLRAQASVMESEGERLATARSKLLKEAEKIDQIWQVAHDRAPNMYPDYQGRDRSQQLMRIDAQKMAQDVDKLGIEKIQLVQESEKMAKLKAAVYAEVIARAPDAVRILLTKPPSTRPPAGPAAQAEAHAILAAIARAIDVPLHRGL
jgi:hypothetical protein